MVLFFIYLNLYSPIILPTTNFRGIRRTYANHLKNRILAVPAALTSSLPASISFFKSICFDVGKLGLNSGFPSGFVRFAHPLPTAKVHWIFSCGPQPCPIPDNATPAAIPLLKETLDKSCLNLDANFLFRSSFRTSLTYSKLASYSKLDLVTKIAIDLQKSTYPVFP
jgi:hypothetical protein